MSLYLITIISWQSQLPHIRFVLPTAPVMSVTMAEGRKMNAWFDRRGARPYPDPDSPAEIKSQPTQLLAIDDSRRSLEQLIASEIELLKPKFGENASKRIVLSGFSQGGVMTYHIGLQSSLPFAGLLAFGGYLPFVPEVDLTSVMHSANFDTRVTIFHGDSDAMINPVAATEALRRICTARTQLQRPERCELKTYAGLGHSFNQALIADAADQLKLLLPPVVDGEQSKL